MKNDKARMASETAIWNHGRRKAVITEAINKLKMCSISDDPDVLKVIEKLKIEHARLSKAQIL